MIAAQANLLVYILPSSQERCMYPKFSRGMN
jgi:hypothetical protein